ncbi:MAG: lactate utilization protein, partial [Candidatus Dadabacteria bacterium]|nr:lactate utilization protein [Candidatus Dadabacteria bacterium]
ITPIHIAVLNKERIVGSIFDLIMRISNDYSKLSNINELSNCITLITGPSRTADIELNLTLGVHGPRELY